MEFVYLGKDGLPVLKEFERALGVDGKPLVAISGPMPLCEWITTTEYQNVVDAFDALDVFDKCTYSSPALLRQLSQLSPRGDTKVRDAFVRNIGKVGLPLHPALYPKMLEIISDYQSLGARRRMGVYRVKDALVPGDMMVVDRLSLLMGDVDEGRVAPLRHIWASVARTLTSTSVNQPIDVARVARKIGDVIPAPVSGDAVAAALPAVPRMFSPPPWTLEFA